jgi:flagellar protein FlbD
MIPLHRITHSEHELWVNPSMIQTIESTPDTIVTLSNATKLVVLETPAEVSRLVRDWKAGVLQTALAAPELRRRRIDLAGAAGEGLQFPDRG